MNSAIVLHPCRLDRCFLELMQDGEEAFLNFRRVVESANVIMATYADEKLGDTAGEPLKPPNSLQSLPSIVAFLSYDSVS